MKNSSWQLCNKAWQAVFNFICIQRTRISLMWLDQFSFRVCYWFLKNRVFEPKSFSQKTTQILQHGISPALSLSYICSVPFWTNKRILHFYLTDFRFCLFSSLKETKIFIVDKWNYERRFDVSKKGLNLLLSYFFLSARNSEFRGQITNWWHSEAKLFKWFLFILLVT